MRPGGDIAIIWPQDPSWFQARGFAYVRVPGDGALHFRDVDAAERLCRDYYSEAAALWVRRTLSADVPYHVLGVSPPYDMCVKRAGEKSSVTLPPRHG